MALPSDWRGYPQTHEVPGGFCVARRVTFTQGASFTQENLRVAAWFGACPWLAKDAQGPDTGAARGILKRLVIRFVPSTESASTTGTALYIADKDASGGDGFNGISASNDIFERTYPTFAEIASFWQRAVSGNVVADVEVYYDIPPAA